MNNKKWLGFAHSTETVRFLQKKDKGFAWSTEMAHESGNVGIFMEI